MANPKMSEVRQPKPRLMLRQARPNLPAGNRKRVTKSHKPGRNITAVAVAFRIGLSVFLPEDHHRDAGTLQLARQGRPVRFDPPPLAGRNRGAPKELEFQSLLGDVFG